MRPALGASSNLPLVVSAEGQYSPVTVTVSYAPPSVKQILVGPVPISLTGSPWISLLIEPTENGPELVEPSLCYMYFCSLVPARAVKARVTCTLLTVTGKEGSV